MEPVFSRRVQVTSLVVGTVSLLVAGSAAWWASAAEERAYQRIVREVGQVVDPTLREFHIKRPREPRTLDEALRPLFETGIRVEPLRSASN